MASTAKNTTDKKREHLYLIDGSGYIFRAYHALPPLTRSDGTPIGAVAGFCNMIDKLVQDVRGEAGASHFAVIFDTARKTFRSDIYDDYKAHRPPPPEDLIPQFSLIRDAVRAFGLPSIEMAGYEADDLIATYARQGREAGMDVTIVSSDKDLMQLVGDGIRMLDTMKNRSIGLPEVMEKFGVGPERVIDVQALAGDSADNVPGVPGIGVKTAALLINEYGDLDAVLARAGEVKQTKRRENLIEHADLARISRELVTLKQDVPVEVGIETFGIIDPDPDVLGKFLSEMEFKTLRAKVLDRMGVEDVQVDQVEEAAATEIGEAQYACVTDLADLDQWIADATAAGFVAVDTETTSLDASSARLVGVSLSIEPGSACYIPLGHGAVKDGELGLGDEADDLDQIDIDEAIERLKPLLEDPAVLKIGQNLKYDDLVLRRYGIRIAPIDDTMLISYVVDGGRERHGMDAMAERYLGYQTIPFKEVAGSGKSQITFDQVPLDKATQYAAEDADITLRLYRILKPRLTAEHMVNVYETLERPLAPVLVSMEAEGIKVDRDMLKGLSAEFAKNMVRLEAEVHELAGEKFNVGSPKQLGEILFDKMSLPGGKKGKTGAYTTNVDVLEDLAAQGHDLPLRVLDWRQFQKLKSTYTDNLQEEINEVTGRVHTSYSMAATSTGRLASNDPNLQNIPIRTDEGRKIRKAFIAEPGNKLLAADYSQIELRILAHMADIPALKQAFADGLDIHAMTASEIFGVPVEGMDPNIRRQAKAINFGIIYGISAFGLARQLNIARGDAKTYIDTYFERFPGIRDYMETTKEFCRASGYVETIFGRKCHFTGINDKSPQRRGFSERAAINAPIQGSAADVIRRAMVRMPAALAEAGSSARMLLQVHDELVFEVPEAELDASTEVITKIMEGAAMPAVQISVPLTVDVGIGDNWDEAH